uniref:Uncharacterized protein n=1 Tax=Rattus norvegicus TaxID=10116 RepID=A0A8I6A2M4_RAT
MLPSMGVDQDSPGKAYLMVPPPPPPSPADAADINFFKIWEAGTSVSSDFSSWKANVSKFH